MGRFGQPARPLDMRNNPLKRNALGNPGQLRTIGPMVRAQDGYSVERRRSPET